MKRLKRLVAVFLCGCLAVGGLTGCGTKKDDDGKIKVVCTIFPEYDWVRKIVGEDNKNVDVELLIKNGVDLHSFQPTADDIIEISDCDMFIYVGGESDDWVDDVLAEAKNEDMVVIDLLDALGDSVKEEEVVEGMEAEEEHEHEEGEEEHEEGEEEHEEGEEEHEHEEGEVEYDEHVWLSLRNATLLCNYISAELCKIDADNKDTYTSNCAAYTAELAELDSEYISAVESGTYDTILVGDRFPFRYLVDDYGINYYAAFVGCSAETEASFETVSFLAGKVDELGLDTIVVIEGSNNTIAETVRDSSTSKDQEIVTLNSIQSITADDVNDGITYLSLMQSNLEALKQALGCN